MVFNLKPLLEAWKLDGPRCTLLTLHADRMEWFRLNSERSPATFQFEQIASMMSELTELQLSSLAAREILKLFPYEKALLAQDILDEDIDDTVVRSTIANVMAVFLTGCSWPKNRDDVNIDEWSVLIVEAGQRLRYVNLKQTQEDQ